MLIFQLERVSDSIHQVGNYVVTQEGTLSWGAGLPIIYFVLFGVIMILGVYLLFSNDKK